MIHYPVTQQEQHLKRPCVWHHVSQRKQVLVEPFGDHNSNLNQTNEQMIWNDQFRISKWCNRFERFLLTRWPIHVLCLFAGILILFCLGSAMLFWSASQFNCFVVTFQNKQHREGTLKMQIQFIQIQLNSILQSDKQLSTLPLPNYRSQQFELFSPKVFFCCGFFGLIFCNMFPEPLG